MTMIAAEGMLPSDMTLSTGGEALAAEIRFDGAALACRVERLSEAGVELSFETAEAAPAAEATLHIPGVGLYRARRLWRTGTRAAYVFELTEFGRRTLGLLIRERFAG
jgi:hypothetical protein